MIILIAHQFKEEFGMQAAALYLKAYGFSAETALFVLTGKAL